MDEKKRQVIEKDRKIGELKGEVEVVGQRYMKQVEELEGKVKEGEKRLAECKRDKERLLEEMEKLKRELEEYRKEGENTRRVMGQIADKERIIEELNE
jgi:peptidoglycan hydrolase CwlO-like protein